MSICNDCYLFELYSELLPEDILVGICHGARSVFAKGIWNRKETTSSSKSCSKFTTPPVQAPPVVINPKLCPVCGATWNPYKQKNEDGEWDIIVHCDTCGTTFDADELHKQGYKFKHIGRKKRR